MVQDLALLAGRVLLAALFAVAALAKLTDRVGARRVFIDFGVPAPLATPLGVLLPLSELAVAVALMFGRTAMWGALGALALLVAFSIGIGVNLTRGRRPDCRCFGQLRSRPVGWSTLVRNGALAAIATFIVWHGDVDASPSLGWLSHVADAGTVGLVISIVGLGVLALESGLLLHVLRQHGRLLWRIEALEARLDGSAPDFRLASLADGSLTLEALRAGGKPVLLLFTDPNCGPCDALLPEIGGWQREYEDKLAIALVSRGTPEANHAKTVAHGIKTVLLQRDSEVADAYGVHATPSAVLVRSDGRFGSRVAAGADAIRALLAHICPQD